MDGFRSRTVWYLAFQLFASAILLNAGRWHLQESSRECRVRFFDVTHEFWRIFGFLAYERIAHRSLSVVNSGRCLCSNLKKKLQTHAQSSRDAVQHPAEARTKPRCRAEDVTPKLHARAAGRPGRQPPSFRITVNFQETFANFRVWQLHFLFT